MEKQLRFVSMLSLREMALRKVAVLLWSDVVAFFCYQRCEDKVENKVLKLKLPKILHSQMLGIVEPIGEDILRWKGKSGKYFEDSQEDYSPDLAKLCFTTAGAVDYKKSAEELARWKKLNVDKRYRIACEYCLENYIPILWKELPAEKREFYSSNENFWSDLPYCWPRIIKGELSELDDLLSLPNREMTSFNQWAFEESAKNANKTAAEYFFLKLTHEEREASLMRTAHAVLMSPTEHFQYVSRHSDLLCYLLLLMTPEQQMKTIKAQPVKVFSPFFEWPLQHLLVENANIIWPFVPPHSYIDMLYRMEDECRNSSSFYFLKVFKEFFMQSPLDFKKVFATLNPIFPYHFCRLAFDSEDSESIEVMFRSVDAVDRMKIVCDYRFLKLFYRDIMNHKWHMVEVCLREANLSKVNRKRLKRAFLGCDFVRSNSWENGTFLRFLKFLDAADGGAAIERKGLKRKLE